MPRSVTYNQKVNQALSFQRLLVDLGHSSARLTREKIGELYAEDFKKKWENEMPGEACIGLSQLRYIMVTRGCLNKRSKDEFLVMPVRRGGGAGSGTGQHPTDNASKKTRSRKKVTRVAVDQHLALSQNAPPVRDTVQPDKLVEVDAKYTCQLCKVTVSSEEEATKHIAGKKHRAQKLSSNLKKNKEFYLKDKNNIQISVDKEQMNGAVQEIVQGGDQSAITFSITNTSVDRSVTFKRCELLKRVRVFQLSDQNRVTDGLNTVTIYPGQTYEVRVGLLANNLGVYMTMIAFTFADVPKTDDESEEEFFIVRYLTLVCTDSLIDDLKPGTKYVPPPRVSAKPVDIEIVEGFPLPRNREEKLERTIELKRYLINKHLRSFVNHGLKKDFSMPEEYEDIADQTRDLLLEGLTSENHRQYFETLLHIEEIQMEVDIRKYDMIGITMEKDSKKPRLLVLMVPGLAENRPSILRGDCLYVRVMGNLGKPQGPEYRGHVHEVGPDRVYLGFNQKLLNTYIPNMKFSVRFEFHRLPLRVQHRAVELAEENSLGQILFPTAETACSAGAVPSGSIRFFDQRVASNLQQKEAVRHILEGSSRPAPYLIFGPPGTGKTVTMVEAIKQVVTRISSSHALVCAPSNSAADLLTERLVAHLDKNWVYRIHALSRYWRSVPQKVQPCSNYDPVDKEFCYPSKADICRYRVVVCTLVTAGRIVSANFPATHFTHVFIDEAGHAVEPEALTPVAGVLECDFDPDAGLDPIVTGQCVLAGDPQQLGAVVRSPIATKHGLGMSFLERLMTSCDVYKRLEDDSSASYNPRLLTKLLCNYRSHPAILRLPNEFFYDNELETHADRGVRESMCRWEALPKKNFPVIFHGTMAVEEREERSPSFFNRTEVSQVVQYVKRVLDARGLGIRISSKDIGIITPYRKQVQKIRDALRRTKLSGDIKVGSVEEFQGQERHVIIISTVRTSPEFLEMDLKFKLGFLKNPKRFNVSVTRAKALLIIIGNPYVLSKDKHWNGFLEYCRTNGAYTGVDYEEDDERLDDLLQRFQALHLDSALDGKASKMPQEEPSVSAKELIEGPEWRKDD